MKLNKRWVLNISAAVFFIIGLTASTNTGFRHKLREVLHLEHSTVLASLDATFDSEKHFRFIKLKNSVGIFLDIYIEEGGDFLQKQHINIGFPNDAHFNYNGRSSNLFLNDVDSDGALELVVPVLDQDLVSHLQIFKYDTANSQFYLTNR